MKRILFSLALMALLPAMAFAEHVEPTRAQKVAKTFLSNNDVRSAQLTDVATAAGFTNLYIFNANPGFVVMAADDCVPPILGYSLTGTFVTDDMPDNVRGWLQGYDDEIQAAIDHRESASSETAQKWHDLENGVRAPRAVTVVDPLIQTRWDQNKYYNNLCPAASNGPGGHVYAGCVATAMAQVMKYWNYPATGQGSHSFTHSTYGEQTANFGETTYNWQSMPNSLNNNSTTEQINAVATLIYHCGVSVDMNYGTGGSGASSTLVPPALIEYFRYSPSATYVSRDGYDDDSWIAFLKQELDESRPLYYCGNNPNSGHAFVCDGYRNDNYFHFNWGWSGSDGNGNNNGYWLIGALNPGSGGSGSGAGTYNLNNAVVAWVEPLSAITAPVLSLTYDGQNVVLSWEAIPDATAYDIYKDNAKVTTIAALSYTDNDVAFGEYPEYYIRAVAGTTRSNPSNFVSVGITHHNRIPQNLQATLADSDVALMWDEVLPQSMDLHYGIGQTGGSYGTPEGTYWGQCYPSDVIGNLYGMSIDKVSIFLLYEGQYTMFLYKDVVSEADNLLVSSTFSGLRGWNEIVFDPVALEAEHDLWVAFYTSHDIEYPAAYGYYEGEGQEHAHYIWADFSQNDWYSMPDGISWPIKVHHSDATFSYNVYRDNALIAEHHASTNYQDVSSTAGAHEYYVTAYENGWESDPSNTVTVTVPGAFTQTVELNEGWTWWTPTVTTELTDLENALGANGILINSQDGGFVRYENGTWSGTLQGFVPGQMYKINVQTVTTITLTGTPVAASTISILPGYNWFGYTGEAGLSIDKALGEEFTPNDGDKIIGQDGTTQFGSTGWNGDLGSLVPGRGYIYQSTATRTKPITF